MNKLAKLSKILFNSNVTRGLVIFILVAVCSILATIPKSVFIHCFSNFEILKFKCADLKATKTNPVGLKFAIYGRSPTEEHLKHVITILERLGYTRTSIEDEWDLLWAHDYPFRVMSPGIKNLKPHQKVNHLPGCGFITNKVDLSTSKLPFLPKAFKIPSDRDEFLNYIKSNPNKLFVEKHVEHRFVFIKAAAEVNLNGNSTFIQEFVQNPYLIDDYKFDIGVYVIITSIDPLRVYIYKGDILFRFCPEKYHPFDAKNVNKYVVGDDYLPIWQVPSLIEFYNSFGFGMKDTFDAYVRDQNENPDLIWKQVENIIAETILSKERHMVDIIKAYKSKNFFELMRFDFIVDDNLLVHLMEANMSPNLSSAHFKPNSLLYEQILYSVMNLIGIGSPVARMSLQEGSSDTEAMISTDKNLVIDGNSCRANLCSKSCNNSNCHMCLPCLSGTEYDIIQKAYREHIHRTDTKRIFPKPIVDLENYNLDNEIQSLTKKNQFMTKWFYGKCKLDSIWCS